MFGENQTLVTLFRRANPSRILTASKVYTAKYGMHTLGDACFFCACFYCFLIPWRVFGAYNFSVALKTAKCNVPR